MRQDCPGIRSGSIGDVINGRHAGRTSLEEVTIFDGTGVGLQDIAVASVATKVALERKRPCSARRSLKLRCGRILTHGALVDVYFPVTVARLRGDARKRRRVCLGLCTDRHAKVFQFHEFVHAVTAAFAAKARLLDPAKWRNLSRD